MMIPPNIFLKKLFDAAVERAHPENVLKTFLPPAPSSGRVIVIGAGKAAASMAAALEAAWDRPLEGLVVTRYGHGLPLHQIEVVEAGHPMPDKAGAVAAQRILEFALSAKAGDTVIFLVSGGASALLVMPDLSVPLEDKQAVTKALLRSGATIHQMNAVRKHLSSIKGGRLAEAAAPARVLTFAISDVPGDHPDVIGSGPTVPDGSTLEDARSVLKTFNITPPISINSRLSDPGAETPKAGNAIFQTSEFFMIATPHDALLAAKNEAERHGIRAMVLSDRMEGEAREVGKVLASLSVQAANHQEPFETPVVLLSGGETTVTVNGSGRGGRNAEFLLGLLLALEGHPRIHAIACDTDGIDGSEDNAGAWIGPTALQQLKSKQIDAAAFLADNNAYEVFESLNSLIVTGPTLTNVNDFRAILIA
jgi:glycerate 2-kinase